MSNELTTKQDSALIEKVLIDGDLSQLSAQERVAYYKAVCNSIGLNPLTKPFDYIRLNNKLVLYAKRDATDQLRKIHGVSITKLERELIEGIYTVIAYASDKTTRTDTAIGAVTVANLQGDAKANAMMKAETKAKRRVTLSIVGLGWLDETEIDTIPNAQVNIINIETGEVVEQTRPAQPVSQPTEAKSKMTRPMTPEQVKSAAVVKSAKFTGKPSEKQADYAFTSLNSLADKDDAKRHTITLYLFGKESSKDLTGGECSFLIDWIGAKADNGYTLDENAVKEAAGIIAEYQRQAGQGDMFETEEIVF